MPLTFVTTPIGNLEDFSLRAIRTIQEAKIVLCEDTRVAKKLFLLIKEKLHFELPIQPTFIAWHTHNENERLKELPKQIDFEEPIIYISDAGSPCISDPGAKLVEYCIYHKIPYDFIGGTNAFVQAYAMSGFLQSCFTFCGFLPQKGKARSDKLREILEQPFVHILYEAPHRIKELIKEIDQIDANREIFIIKEMTKLHQKMLKGNPSYLLSQLDDMSIKGEWTVVIQDKEGTTTPHSAIKTEDIIALDIPKKQKAKLLSKISSKSTKAWYDLLM